MYMQHEKNQFQPITVTNKASNKAHLALMPLNLLLFLHHHLGSKGKSLLKKAHRIIFLYIKLHAIYIT